jgi:hypothetical protein
MKFTDADWERWVDWMLKIRADLGRVRNDASIFATYREIVDSNQDWIGKHHGHRFCQFVIRSYVSAATLGVRRHLKVKENAVSMARLLDQIHKTGGQITLDFYRRRFPKNDNDIDWQSNAFAELSDGGEVVAAANVKRDIEMLEQLPAELEDYADRVLAHLDPRGFEGTFTFGILDDAIQKFDQLVCKYEVFLTGSGSGTLEAVVQYPWERTFDVPLRKPPA